MDDFGMLNDDCIFLILEHTDVASLYFLSLTCDTNDYLVDIIKRKSEIISFQVSDKFISIYHHI